MSMISRNYHGDHRREPFYVDDREKYGECRERDSMSMAAIKGPLRSSMTTKTKSSGVNSEIDWKETADAHVFKIELHGVRKNDVKVEVEDNRVLCITEEKIVEKEDMSDMWRRVERSSGIFYRRISLPDDADTDKVKADMNNGVLTVTVQKYHRHFKNTNARSVQITGY